MKPDDMLAEVGKQDLGCLVGWFDEGVDVEEVFEGLLNIFDCW